MTFDLSFPENFLWGSAISAYQAEGNNYNNNWYRWEQIPGKIKNNDKCGECCDHYNHFEKDFALLSSLKLNAHRTGIEWSRIFPEENEVNQEEIEHYHKVFAELKKNNLLGFVTIHHFTIPLWFEKKGGFLKSKNLEHFKRYCETLSENFPEVEFWNPINEPGVQPLMGYFYGEFPPGKKSIIAYSRAYRNLMKAHAIAYHSIKKNNPKSQVGMVKDIPYFYQKYNSKYWKKWIASGMDYAYNQVTIDTVTKGKVPFIPFSRRKWLKNTIDFFGINYYDAVYFKFKSGLPLGFELTLPWITNRTQLGWGIYPKGLYEAIMRVSEEYKGPIYVTENGIATLDDTQRQKFILDHLLSVREAISDGADVQGFFYWGSMDNWEWAEGFEPRFGLIGIDYKTKERKVRDSARFYGEIAQNNGITSKMIEKYKVKI